MLKVDLKLSEIRMDYGTIIKLKKLQAQLLGITIHKWFWSFITRDEKPNLMIEVKWGDDKPSPNFSIFDGNLMEAGKIQIVKELKREKTYPDGTQIRVAHKWLSEFSLV